MTLAALVRNACVDSGAGRVRAGRTGHADRKIKARLFYVADDGTTLTSVEQDVPFAEEPGRPGASDRRPRSLRRCAEPLVSAVPRRHDAARAVHHGRRRGVRRPQPRARRGPSGRHVERAADGLHPRRRADRQPSGGHVGAAPHRRQGSRDAGRPRRSPAAARENLSWSNDHTHAIRPRPPNQLRRHHLTPNYLPHAEGSVLHRSGPDESDLHGERRGPRAAVSSQHGQGLGDGRVRHAAARDQHAHARARRARAKSAAARRKSSG